MSYAVIVVPAGRPDLPERALLLFRSDTKELSKVALRFCLGTEDVGLVPNRAGHRATVGALVAVGADGGGVAWGTTNGRAPNERAAALLRTLGFLSVNPDQPLAHGTVLLTDGKGDAFPTPVAKALLTKLGAFPPADEDARSDLYVLK
jgi:hypothetical protein